MQKEKVLQDVDIKRLGKVLIWDILNCQTCKIFHNRNQNASLNIYDIAFSIINNLDLPYYKERPPQNKEKIKKLKNAGNHSAIKI